MAESKIEEYRDLTLETSAKPHSQSAIHWAGMFLYRNGERIIGQSETPGDLLYQSSEQAMLAASMQGKRAIDDYWSAWRPHHHKGYMIFTLAIANGDVGAKRRYGFSAYVRRPEIKESMYASDRVAYSHGEHIFPDVDSAHRAAVIEGENIIDGTHPTLNALHL